MPFYPSAVHLVYWYNILACVALRDLYQFPPQGESPTCSTSSNVYYKLVSPFGRVLPLIWNPTLLPCHSPPPKLIPNHWPLIKIQDLLNYPQLCFHQYQKYSSTALAGHNFHHCFLHHWKITKLHQLWPLPLFWESCCGLQKNDILPPQLGHNFTTTTPISNEYFPPYELIPSP